MNLLSKRRSAEQHSFQQQQQTVSFKAPFNPKREAV
jgi:hypothetical protein